MSKMDLDQMFSLAKAARLKAYAPYSHFLVGTCIYTEDDEYFVGCNVENSSFRMTDCAETVAIGTMIVSGVKKIKAVLVIADTTEGVSPCGGCLQKLSEFVDKDTLIYSANLDGIVRKRKFSEMFPEGFTQEFSNLLSQQV